MSWFRKTAPVLIAIFVLALSACPSPFGYYSAGNDVGSTVQTGENSAAAPVATPTFSTAPVSGGAAVIISGSPTESADQNVSIVCDTPNALLYYTTDGSTPNPYAGNTHLFNPAQPIPVLGNGTVKTINVVGFKALMFPSAVATVTMHISYTTASTPSFDHAAGTYYDPFVLTITTSTPGATIWYTTDNSTPVVGSSSSGASGVTVNVNATTTVKAVAAAANYTTSSAASATYSLVPPPTPTGLHLTSVSSSSISIAWNSSAGASSYQLFRDTNAAGSFSTQIYNGSGTSATDNSIVANTVYYYKVQATGTFGSSALSAAIQASGAMLYYPFNGNANDMSGNNWNGTVNGATLTTDRLGAANKAYSLNGTSATITQPAFTFANTNKLTVSLWVYVPASTSLEYFVMGNGFGIFQSGSNVGIAINLPSTSSAQIPINLGAWNHIVGTYDGTTISVYANGNPTPVTTNWPGTMSTVSGLTIGFFASTYWAGSIDDLRIYDRVLSTAEITALYNFVD